MISTSDVNINASHAKIFLWVSDSIGGLKNIARVEICMVRVENARENLQFVTEL